MDEGDRKLAELVKVLGGTLAGPTKLLELSRGLQVTEHSKVKTATNLSTGEVQLVYETEHQDQTGQQFKVPNMFLLALPVFEAGAMYRIPVRLRYRLNGGRVTWAILRHRPELYFENAFNEAVQKVRDETELPVFVGAQET